MRCFSGAWDVATFLRTTLGEEAQGYDLTAIVNQLWEENGRSWDLSGFSPVRSWDIVDDHALAQTPGS